MAPSRAQQTGQLSPHLGPAPGGSVKDRRCSHPEELGHWKDFTVHESVFFFFNLISINFLAFPGFYFCFPFLRLFF